MQLLIVHHDVEVGEQLVRMVKEYTEHHCGLADSERGALDWARGVPRCSLLITQLQGEGLNGFRLAATLSETFAGLQTMFLPEYAAEEQRLDIPGTKVFPEPIDGERLLNAIAQAEERRQTGLDLFHALDVLQMCCLGERSGALQLVKGSQTALVYLLSGRIVHAERGTARGVDAFTNSCRGKRWNSLTITLCALPSRRSRPSGTKRLSPPSRDEKRKSSAAPTNTVETAPPPASPRPPSKASRWGIGRR